MSDRQTFRATLTGCVALLMWASLAVLTLGTGEVPPFLLVALSFGLCAALVFAWWVVRGSGGHRHLRQAPAAWALGVGGLFGYHALFFAALKLAPPVEANLLNYLWPLLIVLFSGLLPGHRLRWFHVTGALCGFAGAALLVVRDGGAAFSGAYALGYACALAAAVIWGGYSVLSRLFAEVPTEAVAGFIAVGAALAFGCHLAFEPPVWPRGWEWAAVVALGVGPAGGAFFFWDRGMKRGEIRLLGALSYLTPLLSTTLLVAFGQGAMTWAVALACLLIIGGATLAGREVFAALLARRTGSA